MTRPPFKKKEGATPVDKLVGIRLRARRMQLGLSQNQVAEQCDVTFQQIQKYETGFNRISASRLVQLCEILGTDANYFLDLKAGSNTLLQFASQEANAEFVRAYLDLSVKQRGAILHMMGSMANVTR